MDFGIIAAFLLSNLYWIVEAIVLALTVLVVYLFRDFFSFLWMRFWYWLPLPILGRTRRLAKNISVVHKGGQKWFTSERSLCSDFRTHLTKVVYAPDHFENAQLYLGKVHEGDRAPMGVGGWLLVLVLVFVEAVGFAMVLADYAIPGIPEAYLPIAAVLIAILLSAILVSVTHYAGREWYRREAINTARAMWNDDEPSERKRLTAVRNEIQIETNNIDDREKPYQHIMNRLKTKGRTVAGFPGMNVFALILIAGVAVGAFFVREAALEQQNVCSTFGPATQSYFSGQGQVSQYPPIVTQAQKANEDRGQKEQCSALWRGSLITYLILGLAFVTVQLIGWTMGKNSGFAGVHSHRAWRNWTRFGTKDEYVAWHMNRTERISNLAQSHLSNLQKRLAYTVDERGTLPDQKDAIAESGGRTFEQFLVDEARKPSGAVDGTKTASGTTTAEQQPDVETVVASQAKA